MTRFVIPETADRLDEFFGIFAAGEPPLLLLDYDGTLAPFRVDRFQARPFAGVRERLAAIQRQGRTRMAVITGRPAGEIGPLLRLDPALETWGLHGAERLFPDGRRELEEAPPVARQALDALRETLLRDSLGGLFEDKANGAVMHWRGLSRRQAERVERRTREIFEPLVRIEGLALLEFKAGLELRTGRNKGEAVAAIVAESRAAGPVAFLGDDLSDEAAFRAVQRLGRRGLSALVRQAWRQTEAEIWLQPPAELIAFLERWLQAAGAPGVGGTKSQMNLPL
jgi:trehalose-phosphatase